jgi:hypothetical protein
MMPPWPGSLTTAAGATMDARIAELLAESRAQEKAGDYAASLRLAEAALAQARELGDSEGICGGHTHIANVHWRMGHFDLARAGD